MFNLLSNELENFLKLGLNESDFSLPFVAFIFYLEFRAGLFVSFSMEVEKRSG
jgi:hypothetical protein